MQGTPEQTVPDVKTQETAAEQNHFLWSAARPAASQILTRKDWIDFLRSPALSQDALWSQMGGGTEDDDKNLSSLIDSDPHPTQDSMKAASSSFSH